MADTTTSYPETRCHCKHAFNTVADLLIHQAAADHRLKCSCGRLFGDVKSYKHHLQETTTPQCGKCGVCFATWSLSTRLPGHVAAVHSLAIHTSCELCAVPFATFKEKVDHKRSSGHLYCEQCDRVFDHDVAIGNHAKDVEHRSVKVWLREKVLCLDQKAIRLEAENRWLANEVESVRGENADLKERVAALEGLCDRLDQRLVIHDLHLAQHQEYMMTPAPSIDARLLRLATEVREVEENHTTLDSAIQTNHAKAIAATDCVKARLDETAKAAKAGSNKVELRVAALEAGIQSSSVESRVAALEARIQPLAQMTYPPAQISATANQPTATPFNPNPTYVNPVWTPGATAQPATQPQEWQHLAQEWQHLTTNLEQCHFKLLHSGLWSCIST